MAKKKLKQPEKKSNIKFLYMGLALLVIAGLALYFSLSSTPAGTPQEKLPSTGKYVKLTDKTTTYEPGKVKMTEFLKFNCGHCYTLNQQLPALKKKYGDKLEVIYKPMLWRSLQADAGSKKSIEAYILAERMGKGEEMKDALFKAIFVDKKDLSSQFVLIDIAKSVGLGDDFAAALERGDAKSEAETNINLAESFEVSDTPTFIINGNIKISPFLFDEDKNSNIDSREMNAMIDSMDKIIGSLLS